MSGIMRKYLSVLCVLMLFIGAVEAGAQGGTVSNQPRSITLEQLLGTGKNSNQATVQAKDLCVSTGNNNVHVGAIGSALERVVLDGKNGGLLSQDMIKRPYVRYVINGTMDLAGRKIDIPEGCILDLEEGRLRNGSVKLSNTLVPPVYGISKEHNIIKVKVSGTYYETLVDLWGENSEPVFPWDTTAPVKVYSVDLKKFGITPGYQKRGSDGHYSDRQYDLMYNNGIGFTKAIRWAYDNGYDGIRFPKGDYCFTPRTTLNDKPAEGPIVLVQDLDKFDIDLGGASYYLILDSSRKSKHYSLAPEKPYAQGGTLFFIAACINLQIHNGIMVGDRALRDYAEGAERSLENSRAFSVSGYCQNIRLHHLDMSDFMADGISCAQSGGIWRAYDDIYQGIWRAYPGVSHYGYYSPNLNGSFTFSEGISPSNITVSNYFKTSGLYSNQYAMMQSVVRRIADKRVFSVNNNLGYTRLINPFHNIEVYTFDENKSKEQPLRVIRTSYLETINLRPEETGVKIMSFYDEKVESEGLQHSETISELISTHVVIENCNFHDNHRGGISGGSNNVTIRNCSFSKNHKMKNHSGKEIPLFLVGGTNYHINFEDSFAKDLKVYGCTFSRTSASIGKLLFGVYTLDFHDNVSDAPVFIYNNIFSDIHDNRFSSVPVWFSSWRMSDYDENMKHGMKFLTRVALVHDNTIGASPEASKHTRTVLIEYDDHKK